MGQNLTSKRNAFLKFYRPFGVLLAKIGLTPNQISVLALISGAIAAYLYYKSYVLPGAFLLLLSGLFDLSDGVVASIKDRATKFGAVFDWVADKIVDGLVIGAIGFAYSTPLITLAAIIGSLVNTFIKTVAYAEIGYEDREKGKIKAPLEGIGIYGRPETHFTIIVFSLLQLLSIPYLNLSSAVLIIAVFTNLSLIHRLAYLYKEYGKVRD